MENVGKQRRAQDEADLLARLAGLELGDHLLGQDIALLDVDLVFVDEARLVEQAASSE
jgi:hypothetical protein